ncbi:hypothetical protein D9611_012628 [Ephemerocybe angulata]|uniref:MYND-type domain-containing protein n=1 Tax=Ephemerocybe angulata TaxID=980116 RepID=A0A8H5ET12_9AGAR|nr:hypothetical protein D9611_012628 [Tulosesus angulatus]
MHRTRPTLPTAMSHRLQMKRLVESAAHIPYNVEVLDTFLTFLDIDDIPSPASGVSDPRNTPDVEMASFAMSGLHVMVRRFEPGAKNRAPELLKATTIQRIMDSFHSIVHWGSYLVSIWDSPPEARSIDKTYLVKRSQQAALLLALIRLDTRISAYSRTSATLIDLAIELWMTTEKKDVPYVDFYNDDGCPITQLFQSFVLSQDSFEELVDRLLSRGTAFTKRFSMHSLLRLNVPYFALIGYNQPQIHWQRATGNLTRIFEVVIGLGFDPRMRRALEQQRYVHHITTTLRCYGERVDFRESITLLLLCSELITMVRSHAVNLGTSLAQALSAGFIGLFVILVQNSRKQFLEPWPQERIPFSVIPESLWDLTNNLAWPKVVRELRPHLIEWRDLEAKLEGVKDIGREWKRFSARARELVHAGDVCAESIVLCDNQNVRCPLVDEPSKAADSGPKGKSKKCSGCSTFVYCGEACQREDWATFHSRECTSAKVDSTRRKAAREWYSHRSRAYHIALITWRFNEMKREDGFGEHFAYYHMDDNRPRTGLNAGATIDAIPAALNSNLPRSANTGRAVVPRCQGHKDESRIAAVEVRSGTSQGAGLHDEVEEDGGPPAISTSSSTLSSGGVEPESHLTPKAEEPQPEVELRLRSPSLEIIEESAYRERHNARGSSKTQTNASGSNVPGISQKALGKRKAVIVPTASPKKKLKRPAATPPTHPIKPESSPPKPPPRPPHKFKEEEVFALPAADVETYLADAPPLPIDPAPSALHVPRNFIYLAYGGSPYQFLQYIPAERNPSQTGSGRRRLVFPMPEMNPAMPLHPGESGLLFASRHEVLSDPPWGVFRKNLDGGEARWLYLGEYESVLVGRMTKAQFRMQRATVKARWAKLIIEQKAFECYTCMRARIALRKHGLLVGNEEEVQALIANEIDQIENGEGLELGEEDVIRAFDMGEEAIDIIRMKCVAYDRVFADSIEEKFKRYPEMKAAQEAKSAKGKSAKEHNKVKRATKGKLKKKHQKVDSDEDMDFESPYEWTSATASTAARPRRRTRQSITVVSTPSSLSPALSASESSFASMRSRRGVTQWDERTGRRVKALSPVDAPQKDVDQDSREFGDGTGNGDDDIVVAGRGGREAVDEDPGYLSYVSEDGAYMGGGVEQESDLSELSD